MGARRRRCPEQLFFTGLLRKTSTSHDVLERPRTLRLQPGHAVHQPLWELHSGGYCPQGDSPHDPQLLVSVPSPEPPLARTCRILYSRHVCSPSLVTSSSSGCSRTPKA